MNTTIAYRNRNIQQMPVSTFGDTIAANAMRRTADYLDRSSSKTSTRVERKKEYITTLIGKNDIIMAKNRSRIVSIDAELRKLWKEYRTSDAAKKESLSAKEVLRRAGKPTDETDQIIQKTFSRVNDLLGKINRLKARRKACYALIDDCKSVNETYRAAISNDSMVMGI